MAMFYRYYSGRSSLPNHPADADQEDIDVEEAGAAPVEEGPIADIQVGAALAEELQLQDAEVLVADVQEAAGVTLMRLDRILRKAPHSRSPLERLAVIERAEHQAQL